MGRIILLLGVVVFFGGCSLNLGTFTIASANNVPIEFQEGDYVEGETCTFMILGIPIGDLQNRITIATMNAMKKANKRGMKADALQNVQVNETAWSALLFGQDCIKVTGQAVKVPTQAKQNKSSRTNAR